METRKSKETTSRNDEREYNGRFDRREYSVRSNFDECPLSILEIAPRGGFSHPDRVRAVVQFAHGMQEHKERYEPFMEFLAEHGIASIIHDHRGHGKSIRKKKDLGYFYDKTGRGIVEDARQVQIIAVSNYPNVPLILFGHSMGSLVARIFLKKYDRALSGLIVCGAPAKNPIAPFGYYLARLSGAVGGEKKENTFFGKLIAKHFADGLEGTHPLRWLSRNEENVLAYEGDEGCGFAFSNNGFVNLFALMRDTYTTDGWEMGNPQLPILFIAGEEDPVTGGRKKWLMAQNFLRGRGYEKVEGKLYPRMRHEILNETDSNLVYDDVLAFIETVIS